MFAGQPSRTLLGPAILRAAHQLFDTPRIFDDPIAVGLVPEASEEAIRSRTDEHQTEESVLLRSLFALRSRFAEDRLRDAAGRGVRQYVIVGAGLDTFPWRQPAHAQGMNIFLADHGTSLDWTRARFRERGLGAPSNLMFVSLDLEQDNVGATLAGHGFDRDAAAFFSVLGVTQYLERRSVEALLGCVASLDAGSEIVFTFVPRDDELEGPDRAFATASANRTVQLGEPWKTRFGAAELATILRRSGFTGIIHLTPDLARQIYFTGRQDELRAPGWEQLIAAVV
ncbi:MAG TPA: SAM-dependent methyltransferase [Xanthobacteraceae bacterium]|nr:SAM-dependent methyltransferase [Xanthobacteraceae bacterium]